MNYSEFAQKVYRWYNGDPQLWSLARVDNALAKGKITQEEYDWIVKGD